MPSLSSLKAPQVVGCQPAVMPVVAKLSPWQSPGLADIDIYKRVSSKKRNIFQYQRLCYELFLYNRGLIKDIIKGLGSQNIDNLLMRIMITLVMSISNWDFKFSIRCCQDHHMKCRHGNGPWHNSLFLATGGNTGASADIAGKLHPKMSVATP